MVITQVSSGRTEREVIAEIVDIMAGLQALPPDQAFKMGLLVRELADRSAADAVRAVVNAMDSAPQQSSPFHATSPALAS